MQSISRSPSRRSFTRSGSAVLLAALFAASPLGAAPQGESAWRARLARLPKLERPVTEAPAEDWLIAETDSPARIYRDGEARIVLDNGLVRCGFHLAPNAACTGLFDLQTGDALLRAPSPLARITIDGKAYEIGGLRGPKNRAFLRAESLAALEASPGSWRFVDFRIAQLEERLEWKRVRHHAPDVQWPPRGVALRLDFAPPSSAPELAGLRIELHYELLDGIPSMSKRMRVVAGAGAKRKVIDRFTLEELALVEASNPVETRDGVRPPRSRRLHVETDYCLGGFTHENANRHVVHWRLDPRYATEVNYMRRMPCLLVVEPSYGPAQALEPGASFETFRVFELVHDRGGRERRSLALRRFYRTWNRWTTENPLMHHMRVSDFAAVRRAIDDAAAVGFEVVILSFGSGFDIERRDASYRAKWRELAEYGRSQKVELGGYSLLSSRGLGKEHMIVSPEGQRPTHGRCPALTSAWGTKYMESLRSFFEDVGFALLEHDGPYPGDVDVTPRPPLQAGVQDSRWVQWRIATDFYEWCRARGIYVNAPDHYWWNGTSKCGMGYRETNWSLPRADQVLHTRQNIYDGTWSKPPSLGWMFVPLSEYHGGGAAATIEPLDEHREHYARMLDSNLGLGVQACFRGPRLFETERTRALVKAKVDWCKRWRRILEADVVHGRRADGRELDWMLHVDPRGRDRGMLVVYNPLERSVRRQLKVDAYFSGLRDEMRVLPSGEEERARVVSSERDGRFAIDVEVPASSMRFYVLRAR